MPLTGDFAKLAALKAKLRSGPAKIRRSVLKAVGEELIDLVKEGFDKATDPYGAPWAPLKYRSGEILQGPTGALKGQWHYKATASKVTIGAGPEYAKYHQSGTSRMPARKMVPDDGLPAEWAASVGDFFEHAMAELFK